MTNCWNVHIITIFPEMFPGLLDVSINKRAFNNNLLKLNIVNLRDYANDPHKTIDHTPYGGGPEMVIRADILGKAIEDLLYKFSIEEIIYMSPRGELLTQEYCHKISKNKKPTIIICGRFEGIDQRIIDYYNIIEISIGNYILSGGEIACQVLLDASIRLIDGVIDQNSLVDESFSNSEIINGGLEYPHFTRPNNWNGLEVPKILLSGNHNEINKWRKDQSEIITAKRKK